MSTTTTQSIPEYILSQLPKPLSADNCEILAQVWKTEYEQLAAAQKHPLGKSTNKDRYDDILPSPEHRVRLSGSSDYINADWCRAEEPGDYDLILAQAPMRNTLGDFARMLLETRASLVISLCEISEEEDYLDLVEYLGNWKSIVVSSKLERKVELASLTVEIYVAEVRLGSECNSLHIMRVAGWPDYGMPSRIADLAEVLREAQQLTTAPDRPIVIHCRAGVGRTGTLAAAWRIRECLQRAGALLLLPTQELVQRMRSVRCYAVQTLKQYVGLQLLRLCLCHP